MILPILRIFPPVLVSGRFTLNIKLEKEDEKEDVTILSSVDHRYGSDFRQTPWREDFA